MSSGPSDVTFLDDDEDRIGYLDDDDIALLFDDEDQDEVDWWSDPDMGAR